MTNKPWKNQNETFWDTPTYTEAQLEEEIGYAVDEELDLLKKGVWQYLVDHTTPHAKGYVIRFCVKGEKDFWWRVDQRATGAFKRNDVELTGKAVDAIIYGSAKRGMIDRELQLMRTKGVWYLKLFMKVRSFFNQTAEAIAEKRARGKPFQWHETIQKDARDAAIIQ